LAEFNSHVKQLFIEQAAHFGMGDYGMDELRLAIANS
jgi:hypothetical protein